MSGSWIELLRHIMDEIKYLEENSSHLECEDFLASETLKRSFVRSIEIIGEASKKLPEEFRKEHSDIPWKKMAGMRDHLIHHYFGVDYDILWDVVKNKIPELKQQIAKLL